MARVAALYCHIPFCHTICPFCAFAVHGNRERLHGPYLAALKEEIRLRGEAHGGAAQPVASLYVGGGTPSTLAPEAVADLIAWIARCFPLASDAEIAFEVNPEDAEPGYLRALGDAGVNRVSLGLQSLHGPTLQALGRNHGPEQGWRAMAALREAGPPNHNLDLMFGAPGIGTGPFRDDVIAVAATEPPHLSLYGLDIEPGTPFARDAAVRAWTEGHGGEQAEQYLWAGAYLAAQGYRHYEVSNFCLPGREGRQNLLVWDGEPYLGFGLGAHSYLAGERWRNERHLRAYLRRLEGGELPEAERERLTPEKQANEALMLALRRDTGLDVQAWEARYGIGWDERRGRVAERLAEAGKARWDGRTLALTLAGFLVADGVTAELMAG